MIRITNDLLKYLRGDLFGGIKAGIVAVSPGPVASRISAAIPAGILIGLGIEIMERLNFVLELIPNDYIFKSFETCLRSKDKNIGDEYTKTKA